MALFEDVKSYVDITWDLTDEETAKLNGIIERGKRSLERKAGGALDFEVDDHPKELLLDYVRYVRSNALDEFEENYLHELLGLQIFAEVQDDTQSP